MDDQAKHRTNIYLFASDVAWLQHRFGYGWTEKVRDLVHNYVREKQRNIEYVRDKIERENPGKDFP